MLGKRLSTEAETNKSTTNARVPAGTFSDILRARAAGMPNKTAFVFLDAIGTIAEKLSYSDLERRARVIAAELLANRLSGERVLLMFPPGLDFVAALFACFYAGAIAVPVPVLPGKRIVDRMSSICCDASPAGVLMLHSLRSEPQFSEVLFGSLRHAAWIETDQLNDEHRDVMWPRVRSDSLAILQYTSGSTSSPKGVKLSHGNLVVNSRMIMEAFGHDENLIGVSWLPLFHDMGLIGHVLQPVYIGGLSVLMSPLSFLQRPVRWLQSISSWKATTSGGPTYAYELCLKAIRDEQTQSLDLSSWRVAYCGSERVRADVLEQFGARFSVNGFVPRALLPCFGLAEATLFVSAAKSMTGLKIANPAGPDNHVCSAVSCGSASQGSSIIVVDPETKEGLAAGAIGEIWVQGPHVAQGYWDSPAVDDTFGATLAGGSGAYLRTGDLGFIEDEQLFVVGRIKDTIIINGLKHCAEDIEARATQIHEVFAGFGGAAFSVDISGREQAVLVQEIGRVRCTPDQVNEAVGRACAGVTREHGLRLFDLVVVRRGSLPRTSSGKIQRARARDIYLADGFKRLNRPLGFSERTLAG